MLLDKEKTKTKAPEERHVIYSKRQMEIDLRVDVGQSELGNIAPLELKIILDNSIDILPRWGKIIVKIYQLSKPEILF